MALHYAGDILCVAVAVVRVDEDRQVGRRDDVAHRRAVLAVLREIDVRIYEAGAAKGETANLIGRIAG